MGTATHLTVFTLRHKNELEEVDEYLRAPYRQSNPDGQMTIKVNAENNVFEPEWWILGCLGVTLLLALSCRQQQLPQQQAAEAPHGSAETVQQQPAITTQVDLRDRRRYKETKRSKRRGDGNCFWRSITTNGSWRRTKSRVQRMSSSFSDHFSGQEQRQIAEAMRPGAWINEPAIRLTVMCLNLDLWVCTKEPGSWQWTTTYRIHRPAAPGGNYMVIAYDEHHYDYIRAGQPSRRTSCKRSCTRASPEGPPKETKEPTGQQKKTTPPPGQGRCKIQKRCAKLQEDIKTAKWSNKKKSLEPTRSRLKSLWPDAPDDDAPQQPTPDARESWLAAAVWGKLMDEPMTCILRCLGLRTWRSRSAERGDQERSEGRQQNAWKWLQHPRTLWHRTSEHSDIHSGHNSEHSRIPDDLGLSDLRGGGLRTPTRAGREPLHGPRPRTRQISVGYGSDYLRTHIGAQHDTEAIERAAALHHGLAPNWIERTWHSETALTIRNRLDTTQIDQEGREHLADLLQPFRLGGNFRALSTGKELYLGLRTTRQPGLTVASTVYQGEIQSLNAHLRARLPGTSWHAIGIIEHGKIRDHVDQGVQPLSVAFTLARNIHYQKFRSPLTDDWQYQVLTKGFVAFDPTKTHGVSGEHRGVTITLYTPLRIPTDEQLTQLRILGFPASRMSLYRGINPTQVEQRPRARTTEFPTAPHSDANRQETSPANTPTNGEGVPVLAQNSCSNSDSTDSDSESGFHIRTTTTSGNGFEPATPVTPEWHSDDQATSRSLASTILEDASHSEPGNLGDDDLDLDRDLQGGGRDDDKEDSIGRATQKTRLLTQKYSKKQLRIIFKIEPRTTRRVLEAGKDEYDQQRIIQMVEAAGRRLTLQPTEKPLQTTKPSRPPTVQQQDKNHPSADTSSRQQVRNGEPDKKGKGKGMGATSATKSNHPQNTSAAKVRRTYMLLPEEWPLPLREPDTSSPHIQLDQDGIYMLEEHEAIKAAAFAAAQLKHKIAVVTPGQVEGLRIAPIVVSATLLSEVQRDRGTQRTRQTNRCRAPVYVYNLTKEPAFTGTKIHAPIKIPETKSATVVLRAHYDTSNMPRQAVASGLGGAMKSEMAKYIPASDILDAWGWRVTQGDEAMGLVRINEDKLETLLKFSGQQGLWTETPISHRHAFAPIWIGNPKETTTLQQAMDKLAQVKNPQGLIRKVAPDGKTSFAIRVRLQEVSETKESLKMDTKNRYLLQGLPPAANRSQAQEVVKQLEWTAEIQEERRWVRGRPTWTIVAQQAPPCSEAQITLGYERCWLTIRPARKPVTPSERIPQEDSASGPVTWNQAVRGYSQKPKPGGMVSGKGPGGAPISGTVQRPLGDPACGEERESAKRPRREPTSAIPQPPPATGSAMPEDPLRLQVQNLEAAMRRMEEMFRRFVEPQGAPGAPTAEPQLQGGGDNPQQLQNLSRHPDQDRQDRERSPRRDENMMS